MKTVASKTGKPLSVPLPRGKTAPRPRKTGHISSYAAEHPRLGKLVDAGEIEVFDDAPATREIAGGRKGRPSFCGHPASSGSRRSGDRHDQQQQPVNERCTDTLLGGIVSRSRGTHEAVEEREHRIARPLGSLAQAAQLTQSPVLQEHREENLVAVDAEVVDAGRRDGDRPLAQASELESPGIAKPSACRRMARTMADTSRSIAAAATDDADEQPLRHRVPRDGAGVARWAIRVAAPAA
jgi:hypothetical protein